jgi:Lsr2
MAKRQTVITTYTCDVTGELCENPVSYEFSWGGRDYGIDLSPTVASEFKELMDKYASKATALPRAPKRTARNTTRSNAEDLAKIRAWAKANGLAVSERGRIPGEIMAAYEAAVKTETSAATIDDDIDDDMDDDDDVL